MATSIFSRRLDLVYLIFFTLHIPIMLRKEVANEITHCVLIMLIRVNV